MKKILVVDDEHHIGKLLLRKFKKNFIVIVCDCVSAAVQALENNCFDIIITDYNLGDYLTGLDLIEIIQTTDVVLQTMPRLKIFLMSGNFDKEVPRNVIFFEKPFDFELMDGLIQPGND